jgi:predicted unusual protein kinase regulating ubiquinone biosynthesis (AarF/ABC1/UbiB family)
LTLRGTLIDNATEMGISLRPENLKRFKDIAVLLIKYGRSDLIKTTGFEEAVLDDEDLSADRKITPNADELAKDLEAMGPTFVKLGQLLSTRADLLPTPYLDALARLQDRVEQFSFAEVETVVTSELGVRLSKAFSEFDSEPIAAASLGQVHRAVMRDGRSVVVKVQRPNIREQIVKDFDALSEIAEFFDKHTEIGKRYEFMRILGEFRKNLLRELDYRIEARNLETVGNNLRDIDLIVVPSPIEDYTTSRVLTMEHIRGKKITELSPLAKIELDGTVLAKQLFRAYLQQILVDGFFHADPHPGNVFLTSDNEIALIDLGMVGQILPEHQDDLIQLLLAISEGIGDKAAEFTRRLGEPKSGFDERQFTQEISDLVARHQGMDLEQIEAGRVVLEIARISGNAGFRLPAEFTMVAKTLLNLDQVVHILDPSFDPKASIRENAMEILEQRMTKSFSTTALLRTAVETKSLLEKLPGRVNSFLDALAHNDLSIKVDAIDEKRLLEAFQKIANRITLGLVIAALIVGAALLTRVETTFRIFGYPGLAMIFFLIAAFIGFWLVINIVFYDKTGED